jgi:hypothetical protein
MVKPPTAAVISEYKLINCPLFVIKNYNFRNSGSELFDVTLII